MITLHESNITSFPHDNGIGVLRDVIRAYAEEELNGLFEFYMEYDSEGHLVNELKEERIIKAKAQDKLGYQLFRIYSITKHHQNDNLIVRAQHITYDLADNFVEKLEANNLTKKQVMELIGSSTVLPHPFFLTSSNTTTRSSTKLYRTNPLQMIGGMEGSVLQIWGGQIERDNFNLILHDRRGSDDGVKVTYEKNITGLEATFDISGLVTRIFPFVFIEGSDNEPDRLITVNGKYIDSPHINDYEKIYIKPIDYSHDERINTDGTDAQIRQQLTNIASQYFKETGNDKIKVDMEVQFEHLWETEEYKDLAVLELVGMGDTVTVEHSRLKVNATAIVNYIRYDCIAEKNEEVRLGSVKARLTDNVNRVVDVAEKVEQAQQTANQAIRAANGKNTIYYGPDEPEGGIEGDLWFRVVDGEYTRTYRHDGIQWQLVLSVDVRDAIDEAQQAKSDAQQAVDRANQATQQATNAINQAQTAFDEAQNALGTASNAYDIATTLQGDVTNLSTLVDEHTGQISSITQSVTGLQTQVSDIEGNVSTLTQTISSLTTRVGDAEGNITTLQQTSSSLAARLTDAEGNITTLTATVNGLQTTVSNIEGDVSSVTQLANALQVRMTDAEGNISTLTQTASSLQSTITAVRDSVGRWTSRYRVRTANPLNLTESDGSLLDDSYTYEVTAKVRGTSTQTTAVAIFRANSSGGSGGAGWTLEKIYEQGKTSNHPEFFIDENGRPSIRLYNHSSYYDVEVIHEKTIGRESVSTRTQSQITQLSDAINLRVEKGDVLSQINIEAGRTLIDTDKLVLSANTTHITGDFKIDGSAHIKDASIGNAQIGYIDAAKINSGELNTNNITIRGGNSTEYTNIHGSTIELRGTYKRTWKGVTTTHDVRTRLHNGHLRFRNDSLDRSLYMSEFGISTYVDGEGELGGSSGTILWWDKTYSPSNSNGITMHSHGGVVALASATSHVVLDSYQSVDIYSRNSVVFVSPKTDVYSGNNNFWFNLIDGTDDGFLMYGSRATQPGVGLRFSKSSNVNTISVVDNTYTRGGNTTFDVGTVRTNNIYKRESNKSVYWNGTSGGDTRVEVGGDSTLRASGIRAISGTSDIFLATNDGAVRVTDGRGYNGGNINYRPIAASNFAQLSSIKTKTNIVELADVGLEVINNLVVYEYDLINNPDLGRQVGLISEYSEIVAMEDNTAIDLYKLTSYNTKAIQELDMKFTDLEDRVNWLEIENQYLKQKIKQLEEMIA